VSNDVFKLVIMVKGEWMHLMTPHMVLMVIRMVEPKGHRLAQSSRTTYSTTRIEEQRHILETNLFDIALRMRSDRKAISKR
jgi:hypothetical protein